MPCLSVSVWLLCVGAMERTQLCERAAEFLRLFAIMCWMVRPNTGRVTRGRGDCRLISRLEFVRTWRYWLREIQSWRDVNRAERFALRHDIPVLRGMIYYLRARVNRRMRRVWG